MATNWSERRNLTMLVDFYELTMSNGYLANGIGDKVAVFDMFFRNIPDNGGFAIFAGLEQLIEYLRSMRFTEEDITFLREKNIFDEAFLTYLKNFEFACDVWAFREGTPIFPGEPVVVVRGPIIQAQLIETMLLLTLNHQSLIATKTNRILRAAQGRPILEFGSRRAQSLTPLFTVPELPLSAAVLHLRAGGPGIWGTFLRHHGAHCADFESEYEAFKYAQLYPTDCTLLVDTYNVISSGIPNAIRVFDEVLTPLGHRPKAVRIDSGDIAYLSKKARTMLDEAGYPDVKIVATNSLDEYIIRDLLIQGAQVDIFGVGEKLITSKSEPVFGGVYKLAALKDWNTTFKIKVSESVENHHPGFKACRFFNGKPEI